MFPFLASDEFLPKKLYLAVPLRPSKGKTNRILYKYSWNLSISSNVPQNDWTNNWDFWSSFKTKNFNGTLCLCHLRDHQSFPPVVMYLTFLQQRSCKVPFWNSQMEETIYGKFLQNQNSINITGKHHLEVFSRRNTYDKCLNIWKYKFSGVSHCGFVTLRY